MYCKVLVGASCLGLVFGGVAASASGAPAEPVSLQRIWVHAQDHAPLLRVARAEASRGRAEVEAASPLLPRDPELTVGLGPRFGSGSAALDVQLSLQQQLPIAGQRGLRVTAAERLRDRAAAQLAQSRWVVRRRIHALFHQALVAREGAKAAGQLVTFAQSVLSIAQRRHKAGDISPLQVRVAEVEVAQARQAKVAADNQYVSARLDLAEASGWPPGSPPSPAGQLGTPRRAPDAQRLFEIARRKAPRLRTRQAAVAEADARLRLAQRLAWPDPTIALSYARESDPVSGGTDATIALFSIGMPIPLWQRNRGQRARAEADQRVALAQEDLIRRTLRVQVARAAAAVTAGAERLAAYGGQILPTLERNLALLRRSWELGEIDLLSIVVAQQRFVRIQRDSLAAFGDYYRAVAQLESVVGSEIWPEVHRGEDAS